MIYFCRYLRGFSTPRKRHSSFLSIFTACVHRLSYSRRYLRGFSHLQQSCNHTKICSGGLVAQSQKRPLTSRAIFAPKIVAKGLPPALSGPPVPYLLVCAKPEGMNLGAIWRTLFGSRPPKWSPRASLRSLLGPLGDPFGYIGLFWPPVGPLWVRMWAKQADWMDAVASLPHSFGAWWVQIVPMAPLRVL